MAYSTLTSLRLLFLITWMAFFTSGASSQCSSTTEIENTSAEVKIAKEVMHKAHILREFMITAYLPNRQLDSHLNGESKQIYGNIWPRLGELTEQMQQLREILVNHNNSKLSTLLVAMKRIADQGCEAAGMTNCSHSALQKLKIYKNIEHAVEELYFKTDAIVSRSGISANLRIGSSAWLSTDMSCGLSGEEFKLLKNTVGKIAKLTLEENCCTN